MELYRRKERSKYGVCHVGEKRRKKKGKEERESRLIILAKSSILLARTHDLKFLI